MKLVKAIYIKWTSTTSNNTFVNVSCPFAVKHIHVKSISYNRNGAIGTANYGVLTSSLAENQPLGVFYDDNTYSTSGYSDLSLEFRIPTIINGQYSFSMWNSSGAPKNPLTSNDDIIVIVEFDSGQDI